jgi:glycosyltransferase involved in cell wall biosynthesis
MNSTRSLEVVGPFKGSSGYDRHTREFVREFVRQGVNVKLTPLWGWSIELPPAMRETWFDDLDSSLTANTVLHFTMPNQAEPRCGKRNVNYTMFEAERIPQRWADCAPQHDLIVVPTESSYHAWAMSGVPEAQLRICPLGVDSEYFSIRAQPAPLQTHVGRALDSYRYRFLNVAELRPRKNHLGLLRSWIRATRPDDEAVLILKASVFQEGVMEEFQADLMDMQQQLGRSLNDAAPVVLIGHIVTSEMIRSLYASATHYLSLSRGEGWDQAMMEAAVAGLQLIAPKHSAYLTYLNEEDAYLIPSSLRPARFEGRMGMADWAWFAGLRWWEPDEDAAVEIIRGIVRGEVGPKPSPQARIARDYTWAKAARRLLELIL